MARSKDMRCEPAAERAASLRTCSEEEAEKAKRKAFVEALYAKYYGGRRAKDRKDGPGI